jgi:hypothetical protein
VTASFIRFELTSNYGSTDFIGFSEVAFSGVAVNPVENVINPVSATTTLTAEFGSSLTSTINGSGLDTFPSLSASHGGANPGTAFYATNGIGTIDFDLGGSYLVDGLSFWNVNATGPPQTGIQDVIIYSSEDGVTYTVISGAPTVFSEATSTTSAAEQFSFTEVTASFIRFELTSNYGSTDFIGFSEVAFSGVAVNPVENVINPVSATTTWTAAFGTSLDNTINGIGLDAFPSLSANHGMSVFGNSFVATNEPGTIDFDLGGSFLVDGLSFWNQNFFGPQVGENGIKDIIISSSEDGVTYTPIAGAPSIFAKATCMTCPAEQISFTEVTASFIRFEVLNNWGEPTYVAFSEVAFSGVATLGITDSVLDEAISLYPNPASDVINISNNLNVELEDITIYDINGRVVIQHVVTDSSLPQVINVSELSSGIYMVQIKSAQAHTIKRIIKN